MKSMPSKVSYSKTRKKRNMWVFDGGLHTLHMRMGPRENDMEFVERFLVEFFKGCHNRAGKQFRDFFIWHNGRDSYMTVWGVK
jgi:hypothetical protein